MFTLVLLQHAPHINIILCKPTYAIFSWLKYPRYFIREYLVLVLYFDYDRRRVHVKYIVIWIILLLQCDYLFIIIIPGYFTDNVDFLKKVPSTNIIINYTILPRTSLITPTLIYTNTNKEGVMSGCHMLIYSNRKSSPLYVHFVVPTITGKQIITLRLCRWVTLMLAKLIVLTIPIVGLVRWSIGGVH